MAIEDPLIAKLGIKYAVSSYCLFAPPKYSLRVPMAIFLNSVLELPEDCNWIQAFYDDSTILETEIPKLVDRLGFSGALWLCWPKKASGLQMTLSDTEVRRIGLAAGLVDVKVAAIDEIWSALKFVYRKSDRV